MRQHALRAEFLGEPRLVLEARHREHAHVRVQHAQDRDREQAERAAAVDERGAARRRRRVQDRVQRHRERIGEHRGVVADRRRESESTATRAPGTRGANPPVAVALLPLWMPGASVAAPEVQALREIALLAPIAERQAARRAREPGIQHHALADPPLRDAGADLVDHADHLVSEHLRPRDHRGHRVVERPVHEHLLVVAAAQPAQARARHRPVGRGQRGRGDLAQLDRRERTDERARRERREQLGGDEPRHVLAGHERAHEFSGRWQLGGGGNAR